MVASTIALSAGSGGAPPADAQEVKSKAEVVRQARSSALEEFSAAVQSGPVEGRIAERTPGTYQFLPSGWPQLALPIDNPDKVAPLSVGPSLSVRGQWNVAKSAFALSSYSLVLTAPAIPAGRTGDSGFADLASALRDFSGTVNRHLRPGAMGVRVAMGDEIFADERKSLEDKILDVYATARNNDDQDLRRATVAGYRSAQQQLKAIYGAFDNFPPWTYRRIYENSRAAVAIGRPEETSAICSGVLVASDLALTAGHCFSEDLPEDLEVWFDYSRDSGGALPLQRRRITRLLAPAGDRQTRLFSQDFGTDLFDFAIVRFAADPESGVLAPASAMVQCLNDASLARERRLYVIGFPKGQRAMVHDNGRIYLPFRLRRRQFEKLQLEIEADFSDRQDAARRMEEFTRSYIEIRYRNAPAWELYDVRYGGQPKIGIVADTFRGNSGAPVYDRESHCIIGILMGGAPDTGERRAASWEFHESVLPVLAILEDLNAHDETRSLVEALEIQ